MRQMVHLPRIARIAIAAGVLSAASLAFAGRAVDEAEARNQEIWREAVARSRSADETVAKNLPVFMQTAAAISERIDARAAARVKIINAGLSTAQAADDPPTAPIAGEMPPMYIQEKLSIRNPEIEL